MIDRFQLMAAWLSGLPAPPLPALLGRRHVMGTAPDGVLDAAELGRAEAESLEIGPGFLREFPRMKTGPRHR